MQSLITTVRLLLCDCEVTCSSYRNNLFCRKKERECCIKIRPSSDPCRGELCALATPSIHVCLSVCFTFVYLSQSILLRWCILLALGCHLVWYYVRIQHEEGSAKFVVWFFLWYTTILFTLSLPLSLWGDHAPWLKYLGNEICKMHDIQLIDRLCNAFIYCIFHVPRKTILLNL